MATKQNTVSDGDLLAKLGDAAAGYYNDLARVPGILFALFCMIAIATALELLSVGWRESSARKLLTRSGSVGTDLLTTFLYQFKLLMPLGILMSGGVVYLIMRFFRLQLPQPVTLDLGSPIVSTLVFLVILDFFRYWWHRSFHKIPSLWVVHRYHHSAPEMNLLNTYRAHPLEGAIGQLWLAFPLLFIGAPLRQVFAIQFVVTLHGLVCHSNLRSDWGWVGSWLIQSPAAHRIHHSREPSHYGKNLGSTLVVWDRMFGTFHRESPEAVRAIEMGLDGKVIGQRPLQYILRVYLEFLNALSAGAKSLVRQVGIIGRSR